MRDITPYISKSTIKPEIAHVYVYGGYAMATDSFRLIEIKLDEFCTDNTPNGFYTAEKWKKMCKAYNKKEKDLYTYMVAVNENNLNADARKGYKFPDHKKVIPNVEDLRPIEENMSFNPKYLQEFIEFAQVYKDGVFYFDFSRVKTDGKMLYFEDANTKVLLMKLNR